MIETIPGFEDREDRNEFLIALLVLAFFGCMLFWFVFDGDVFAARMHARLTGTSQPPTIQAATPDHLTPQLETQVDKHVADSCLPDSHIQSDVLCDQDQIDASDTIVKQDAVQEELQESEVLDAAKDESTPAVSSDDLDNESNTEPVDSDKDGIADIVDACPNAAGFSEDNGCPKPVADEQKTQAPLDSDNDGIADFEDLCPKSPGVNANRGCPADSDEDGLPDDQDQCPDIAGVLINGGCPADTDADGISDEQDACPELAGDRNNQGCPEQTQQTTADTATVTSIATGITFETASSRLTEDSKALLDEVAEILSRYPSIKLTVEGHTDDLGDAEINLKLSEQRARACVSYLSRKGIDASRMNAVGYGETRPLGANSSADARRRNRRVEFKISNQ